MLRHGAEDLSVASTTCKGRGRTSTLIGTAKLNDDDPQAWLADVLACIAKLPHTRVHELLPWNWKAARDQSLAA